MKVSKLIKQLERYKKKHGDIDVYIISGSMYDRVQSEPEFRVRCPKTDPYISVE